jgi:hypothetical protein
VSITIDVLLGGSNLLGPVKTSGSAMNDGSGVDQNSSTGTLFCTCIQQAVWFGYYWWEWFAWWES